MMIRLDQLILELRDAVHELQRRMEQLEEEFAKLKKAKGQHA